MLKNVLLTSLLIIALFSVAKAEIPDTVWCKYTYPTQINAVKFTTDGKCLATGGSDGIVNIWDVETGNLQQRMQG